MSKIVIISGGIGAGKSIVSKILRAKGYSVYDCDIEARKIMDKNTDIHNELNRQIHPSIVTGGAIDRKLLGEIVFNDTEKLRLLNTIVHKHVIEDVTHRGKQEHKGNILFVETAIPFESGLDRIACSMWEVTAPTNLRIARVMKRNKCTAEEVKARINAQSTEITRRNEKALPIDEIINDEITPLLPQIDELIQKLSASLYNGHLCL